MHLIYTKKRVPEGIQVEVRKPPAMVDGNNYQPLPRTAHKETKKYLTITAIKGTIISIDPATPMAVYDSYAQPGGAFHFEEVYKFSFPIYNNTRQATACVCQSVEA